MLGMLGESSKHGIERRMLGVLAATVGLQIFEHLSIVGIALQLGPAMPPEIADEEELDPGKQAVGPVLEVVTKMEARRAEIGSAPLSAAEPLAAQSSAVAISTSLPSSTGCSGHSRKTKLMRSASG
jgi:hypothetical protein